MFSWRSTGALCLLSTSVQICQVKRQASDEFQDNWIFQQTVLQAAPASPHARKGSRAALAVAMTPDPRSGSGKKTKSFERHRHSLRVFKPQPRDIYIHLYYSALLLIKKKKKKRKEERKKTHPPTVWSLGAPSFSPPRRGAPRMP